MKFCKSFIDIKYFQTFTIISEKILQYFFFFFLNKSYVKASVNTKLYNSGSTDVK